MAFQQVNDLMDHDVFKAIFWLFCELRVKANSAGVPIERVSILLGHQSMRITEKHYSPWMRARQEQLEADVQRAWADDPVIASQVAGTKQGQFPKERFN